MSPTIIRVLAALGLLWNAVGVYSYLGFVGMVAPMEPPSPVEMPAWAHAAFAVGVFGGILGCVALLLLHGTARLLLWLSFFGSLIDWLWVFSANPAAPKGLGIAVIAISLLLALLAEQAVRRGLLRETKPA